MICNAWVPISNTANCTDVVSQDSISPSSYNANSGFLSKVSANLHAFIPA